MNFNSDHRLTFTVRNMNKATGPFYDLGLGNFSKERFESRWLMTHMHLELTFQQIKSNIRHEASGLKTFSPTIYYLWKNQ